jgi:hypothetical protein
MRALHAASGKGAIGGRDMTLCETILSILEGWGFQESEAYFLRLMRVLV